MDYVARGYFLLKNGGRHVTRIPSHQLLAELIGNRRRDMAFDEQAVPPLAPHQQCWQLSFFKHNGYDSQERRILLAFDLVSMVRDESPELYFFSSIVRTTRHLLS